MDPPKFVSLSSFPTIYQEACIIAWKNKFQYHLAVEQAREKGIHIHRPTHQNRPPHPDSYLYAQVLSKQKDLSVAEPEDDTQSQDTEEFTMVQLVEVEDEHFQGSQKGPIEDDADFTDTDSEISDDSDYDPMHESLGERLYALKDMIPPTTRGWIGAQVDTGARVVQNTWYYGSRTLWVVCATALMIGVPLATCWAEDQQLEGMEREYRMREMGGELLTAGEGKEGSTADQLEQSLGKAEARPSL